MAHKAMRSIRGVPTGRQAARMMERMGMDFKEIAGVTRVIIETTDKQIVIEEPNVVGINMQGQTMYQVAGGTMREESLAQKPVSPVIPDADVKLVCEQTGKTLDEARKALAEANGDLAKAILSLKSETQ